MPKWFYFAFLVFLSGINVLADTGYGNSGTGSLTSLPPAQPVLSTPANHSGTALSVLDWNDLDHASSYILQVSLASNFDSYVVNESGLNESTYDAGELVTSNNYYWRVCAVNVAGTGAYSDTWDFTFDTSLPVELISFSATREQGSIVVSWRTETESNNLGFILERTRNITNPDWQVVVSYETHSELAGRGTIDSPKEYTFRDTSAQPGTTWFYRLSDVSYSGDLHVCGTVCSTVAEIPETTELLPLYPNPFNPQTHIRYTLAEQAQVELSVYDINGRKVRELSNCTQSASSYNVQWDSKDDAGNSLPSGMYLVILKANNQMLTQKAFLIK